MDIDLSTVYGPSAVELFERIGVVIQHLDSGTQSDIDRAKLILGDLKVRAQMSFDKRLVSGMLGY